jgi:hypothetical protein
MKFRWLSPQPVRFKEVILFEAIMFNFSIEGTDAINRHSGRRGCANCTALRAGQGLSLFA